MKILLLVFGLLAYPASSAPVTLGHLQNANNFNRATFSTTGSVNGTQGFINYGINLNSQTYNVHLPSNYTPSGTYGLINYIDAGDAGTMPAVYQSVLDKHGLIFLAGTGIGNTVTRSTRAGVAVMGSYRMCELHQIDRSRIYLMGNSGGGRLGMDVVYARPDWFGGFIGLSGASFGGYIPDWAPPGRLQDSNTDNDYWPNDPEFYEVSQMISYSSTGYRAPPTPVKVAFQAFHDDFRRTELIGTYRYAFMNHGAAVRLVYRNGGHSASNASAFDETVRFMQHPYVTVIRDRFEDANLATNTDPANTLERGSGFLNRSFAGGSATEANYSYNSKTQKVLRLTADGGTAAVEAKNRFNWFNPHGIILDVKLRAETQAGNNQQIGIHIARGDSDDTPEDNPGLHVFRNHGGKNQLILVKADGSSVELARWDYSGTHPMAMTTSDKLFWDSTAAPEYAGKTRDFRGEDLRVAADNNGLQLTFSRTITGLETTFTNGVILGATARTVTSTTSPYYNQSDQEEHPILLQFLWDDMGLRADVEALDFRHWKLLLSNRAFNPALAAGDALVDELTLIAPAEETNFTAPNITTPGDLTVNATSGNGATVNFSVTATAESGAALSVTCVPPSGSGFPIGSTPVTCTATDANGNTATATFNVIVQANGFNPSPPSAPLPPSISPGLTAATLVWQPTNFATSYSVKRASSPDGPFTAVATGLTTTTFTDTGLVHNVPAYYVLTASNDAGESAPSEVATVTTTPGTATKADNSAAALDTLAAWTANQLPGSPDIALWDATVTTSSNVSVGNGTSLGGIQITNPGGNVSISSGGAETLTLGSSGIDLSACARSLTLTAPVVLAADQAWTSGSFGSSGATQILADSVISGSGKLSFTQTAGRALSLTRANTFTGGFTLGAGAAVTVGTSAVVSSGNTTSSAFGAYNGNQMLTIEGETIDHAGFGFHAKNVRITSNFKFINNARINFGGALDMAGGTRTITLVRSTSNSGALTGGGNATLNVSNGGAMAVSNGTLRIVADASVPAGNFVLLTPQTGTAFTGNAGFILGDKVYYGKAGTGTLNGATTVPSVTLEAGSVWDLSDGNNARNPQVNSLAGAGSVVNTWGSGGTGALHTLTIKGNSNNGRTDFSGSIFDNGGTIFPTRTAGQTAVVKEGATTQIFSGTNTYTGTTSVNGGALLVNGSIASLANLTVATTATLGGSGSIAAAATVNGTLAPGDGPGTLTLTGSLAMAATSKLQWQLPTNASTGGDFLNAAAVTVANGATLDLLFNAPGSTVSFTDPFWQSNRSWPVLSSTGLTGTFTLGTISADSAARAATGYGVFSLTHANNAVTLVWTALSPIESWRYANFGTTENTGNAADSADPDNDGVSNLAEYNAGTNPNDASSLPSFIWTSTDSGNWSTGANWNTGSSPASNPATKLEFLTGQAPGTISITATNDIPGTFQLNQLTLSGTNTTTATNVGLSGSPLRFVANATDQPVIALTASTSGFTYTIENPITLDATTTFSATNTGKFIFNGPITGPGGLTRTSTSSTLILSADNSYQGTTTISAGILQIGNDGATGTPGSGPIVNNGTLRIDRSGTLDLTHTISGSGGIVLDNVAATDTAILGGDNSFSGNIRINRGTLRLTRSEAAGSGPKILSSAGADRRIQLSNHVTLPAELTIRATSNSFDGGGISNLDGANRIDGPIEIITGNPVLNISSTAGTLTIAGDVTLVSSSRPLNLGGASASQNTISGAIRQSGQTNGEPNILSVTKQGAGTWEIASPDNTYTGPTTINTGKFILSGSLTSDITATAGTLTPQGTPSTTGSLDIQSGGTFEARPGDTLTIGGTVTLAGNLNLIAPPGLAPGTSYTLLNKSTPGAISGTFANKPEGAVFSASGYDWKITYTGGDGNDVVVSSLTAVEQWRHLHFGSTDNSEDSADTFDANNDGEPNLLEFATAQDPHATTRALTQLEFSADDELLFTYSRNKDAFTAGYLFKVEYSDTLAPGSWTSVGPGTVLLDGPPQSVRAIIPIGSSDRRFIRLHVSAP